MSAFSLLHLVSKSPPGAVRPCGRPSGLWLSLECFCCVSMTSATFPASAVKLHRTLSLVPEDRQPADPVCSGHLEKLYDLPPTPNLVFALLTLLTLSETCVTVDLYCCPGLFNISPSRTKCVLQDQSGDKCSETSKCQLVKYKECVKECEALQAAARMFCSLSAERTTRCPLFVLIPVLEEVRTDSDMALESWTIIMSATLVWSGPGPETGSPRPSPPPPPQCFITGMTLFSWL